MSRRWRLCGVGVVFLCMGVARGQEASLPDLAGAEAQAQIRVADPLMGSITGTVTDSDGEVVAGAKITLVIDSAKGSRSTVTDAEGRFRFDRVAAGKFTLTLAAEGMANGTQTGSLEPAENYEVRPVALTVAGVTSEVSAMTVHQQAEEEMKVEEKQRLGGVLPNFYVAYNWNAAPLSAGQKFRLAWKNTIDPVNVGLNAAVAGYEYGVNSFAGYGRGFSGYMKRFGANEGDLAVGTYVGGAILPVILKQDPRYFYKGTGTIRSRLLYALASTVICRGDNGKWQPNYSSIGGDVAAGAIANMYYPSSDKDGASVVIEQGLIGAVADGLSNVVQEFLLKKVTPHSASYSSTTP